MEDSSDQSEGEFQPLDEHTESEEETTIKIQESLPQKWKAPTRREFFNSVNIRWLWFEWLFAVGGLIFFASIAISYIAANDWFKYFILYSYWIISITWFLCLVIAIHSGMRLYMFLYNRELLKSNQYLLSLEHLCNMRDILLVSGFIQVCISSIAYWAFVPISINHSYPTLMAHSVSVLYYIALMLLVEFKMYDTSLLLSFGYCFSYYLFTITVKYVAGYWIYDVENTALLWNFIVGVIVIGQTAYFYISKWFLNPLKNEVIYYLYIYQFRWSLEFQPPAYGKYRGDNPRDDLWLAYQTLILGSGFAFLTTFLTIGKASSTNPLCLMYIPFIAGQFIIEFFNYLQYTKTWKVALVPVEAQRRNLLAVPLLVTQFILAFVYVIFGDALVWFYMQVIGYSLLLGANKILIHYLLWLIKVSEYNQ